MILDQALLSEPGTPRPRLDVPATGETQRNPRGHVLSLFSVLGIAALTLSITAPLGSAFAVPDIQELGAEAHFQVSDFAQSLVVGDSVELAGIMEQRGQFSVEVKLPVVNSAQFKGKEERVVWLTEAGIDQKYWDYVNYIVQRESSWNPNATNKTSGACGLVQALPCSKVPGDGYNPVDNLRWANNYATKRYGGWEKAYAFWIKNHWW